LKTFFYQACLHAFGRRAGLLVLFVALVASAQATEKLSLNDALTIALKNNPEISAAQKEIDAAFGRVLQQGAFPTRSCPQRSMKSKQISISAMRVNKMLGCRNRSSFPVSEAHGLTLRGTENQLSSFHSRAPKESSRRK
jgi:hypothetical protein